VRIGVTDTLSPEHTVDQYLEWIRRFDPAADFVVLSHRLDNAGELARVDGLLMTGGGDVHPSHYGSDVELNQLKGVDGRRDAFELDLVDRALEINLPILGVCRGMQLVNVYLGGSVIVDLVSAGYNNHASAGEDEVSHEVIVAPGSLLGNMTRSEQLVVNSSHHQAVGRLGNGLMVGAASPDGVTESAEWIVKDRMPFLLLVQWHPERMKEVDHPAARTIAEGFLREVRHSMEQRGASSSIHSTVN
jgi:putative glutamine amidotransferase